MREHWESDTDASCGLHPIAPRAARCGRQQRIRKTEGGGGRNCSGNAGHSPRVERDFGPLPAVVLLKVKVVHSPPALSLGEVRDEVVVRGARVRLLLDDDLREVFAEREDDVLGLLAQLQLLVRREAVLVYGNAGGLRGRRAIAEKDVCGSISAPRAG